MTSSDVTTEDLTLQVEAAERELAKYKSRVRDRVIKAYLDRDLNFEAANEELEELGLEPFEIEDEAYGWVKVSWPVTVRGVADPDEARRIVSSAIGAWHQAADEVARTVAGMSFSAGESAIEVEYFSIRQTA
ncbi:hypothetical protein ACFS2C_23510 [Prauserella oleivorans]|uniref:Uncharacterized protein n=1 Tax=Prauserella oleivorans TaxID=1478153 RepID=A0ABW5WIX4_9PSEU